MASPVIQNNFRARKTFAKIAKIIDIPNPLRNPQSEIRTT